jgi:hypothetical protein
MQGISTRSVKTSTYRQSKSRKYFGIKRVWAGFVGLDAEAEAIVITPDSPSHMAFIAGFPEPPESMSVAFKDAKFRINDRNPIDVFPGRRAANERFDLIHSPARLAAVIFDLVPGVGAVR